MKSNGPFPSRVPAKTRYLKKNLIITPHGIVIEPGKLFHPTLLEILGVGKTYEKTLPHRNRVLEKERRSDEHVRMFKGGLGLCLCLA